MPELQEYTLPSDEAPTPKRLYSMPEAARLLGIHVQTARRLALIGEFPVDVFRLGTRWYVRCDDLDDFLSKKPS